MTYYHGSPKRGLRVLEPRKPEIFDKPAKVYMTSNLSMALIYGIRNFEYTYGYTEKGELYLDEYFPDALRILYQGKSASLYVCEPESVDQTVIPNEIVSEKPVRILEEVPIPDVYDALLEQERCGNLIIHRFGEQSERKLDWICRSAAQIIRKNQLLHSNSPMATYYHMYYPISWLTVKNEAGEQHDPEEV